MKGEGQMSSTSRWILIAPATIAATVGAFIGKPLPEVMPPERKP
jgi:hypothetical protein